MRIVDNQEFRRVMVAYFILLIIEVGIVINLFNS